jgi:hypothetical protein
MIAKSSIWASALITAPAIIATPWPRRALGEMTALGLMALMIPKPIRSSSRPILSRRSLSPRATNAQLSPDLRKLRRSRSVATMGTPKTEPEDFFWTTRPTGTYSGVARKSSMTTFACPPRPSTRTGDEAGKRVFNEVVAMRYATVFRRVQASSTTAICDYSSFRSEPFQLSKRAR